MAFFETILTSDTFLNWLTKQNSNTDFINAVRYPVNNYLLDSAAPPTIAVVAGRTVASFSASATNTIYFDFPALSFKSLSEDRFIRLTYVMSTSVAGDVVLEADFNVFEKDAVVSVAAPTETDQNTITVNPTALTQDYDESLKLSAANLTNTTDFVRVKLSRLGAEVADDHTGTFHLFDIEIV